MNVTSPLSLRLDDFWYIAAPAGELGQRPIRRRVEGEPLVLFRDRAGKPRALLDRCAHRGMALSAGRTVGDCVECPYHGWRFDGEGRLRALPALAEGEEMPRPRTMRAFEAVESDEHIWVFMGQEKPRDGPFRFPYYGQPGWTSFFMHTRFAAPVEACLENFLDVPHTVFVHPGLFRDAEAQETRVRITRREGEAVAEFLDEQELSGWGPRLIAPKADRMEHTDRFLLPSITRVDYVFGDDYRFVITSQCTSREENVVDVTTAITWRLRLPGWLLEPFLRLYCRHVIRQDVDILEIQGEQNRLFGPVEMHTEADLLGRHIRALRRRAARGADAGEAPRELVRDVVMKI